MASKIKETPILKGMDAKIFLKGLDNIKKLDAKERERIKANYQKINSIAQF